MGHPRDTILKNIKDKNQRLIIMKENVNVTENYDTSTFDNEEMD